MTNERELVREPVDDERELPCFVRHPDAGGQCWRPAVMQVYGLGFCEVHGPEAKLGAMSEAAHDAGADYDQALVTAYSENASEQVREQVREWQQAEEPGYLPAFDSLMRSLDTLYKVMRIAYEADETWLVEILEQERESVAAQAAVALEGARPIRN